MPIFTVLSICEIILFSVFLQKYCQVYYYKLIQQTKLVGLAFWEESFITTNETVPRMINTIGASMQPSDEHMYSSNM